MELREVRKIMGFLDKFRKTKNDEAAKEDSAKEEPAKEDSAKE